MNTYKCEFTGRVKGAIGVFSHGTCVIEAENQAEVIKKLYEKYEYIQQLKIDGKIV